MELFKYRNVAFGCCFFLISLLASYYISVHIRIVVLASAGAAILLLFLLYLLKSSKQREYALTRYTPALLLVICAMIISLISFDTDKLLMYCDKNEHRVTATVFSVTYQNEYFGYYEIDVHTVDGNKVETTSSLNLNDTVLSRGDKITFTATFTVIGKTGLDFDEASYMLSKGIVVCADGFDCVTIGHTDTPFLDFCDNANAFLSSRLETVENQDTFSLMSAVFLGNKDSLSLEIQRDFTRSGLNHILALSGMHITIIVTIIGFALAPIGISRILKELILIISTLTFVGITGFSDSALRAGIMVCLVYTFYFFGNRTSIVSSLLYSVSLICAFKPFSIFSLSLWLSFSAMLGCIISSKFIHRVKLFRAFKIKILRFIILSLICSLFAILFTLPIVSVYFGKISLISIASNLVVAPLMTLLIYLCPIYLLFSGVPYLSYALEMVATGISKLSLTLAGWFGSIDGVLLPINNKVQIYSAVSFAAFLVILLFIKRKYLKACICCLGVSLASFLVGCVILYADRFTSVYMGAYTYYSNDIVYIEDMGQLTIVDLTSTAASYYRLSNSVSNKIGYYEIENYIITDYSSTSHTCFNNLSSSSVVKNVYVPLPADAKEEKTMLEIKALAEAKGIGFHTIPERLMLSSTEITFSSCNFLPRSVLRATSFNVTLGNTSFTYLGAATFELADYFAQDNAYTSDILIFGSYGPTFKVKYGYRVPYLDHCVFLGYSDEFALDSFKDEVYFKTTENDDRFYRFKILS